MKYNDDGSTGASKSAAPSSGESTEGGAQRVMIVPAATDYLASDANEGVLPLGSVSIPSIKSFPTTLRNGEIIYLPFLYSFAFIGYR